MFEKDYTIPKKCVHLDAIKTLDRRCNSIQAEMHRLAVQLCNDDLCGEKIEQPFPTLMPMKNQLEMNYRSLYDERKSIINTIKFLIDSYDVSNLTES